MGIGRDNEKTLGKRLQTARRQAGLTQQELCQKAGLSYSTLAKIERGAIASPSVFTVAAIAEATGVPLNHLLAIKSGSPHAAPTKKTSKTGVKFVYFDVNNVLVRFFQRAFAQIAGSSGRSIDIVEALYWRHNDAVSSGHMTLAAFNDTFKHELGLKEFDWQKYYLDNLEPMPGIDKLVAWATEHYEVGLLTNQMPGFVDSLRAEKLLPEVSYTSVIDSSRVGLIKPAPKIYDLAVEASGVAPKEILLVDDTRLFLTAADQAGWQITWFNELEPADSIARVEKYLEF